MGGNYERELVNIFAADPTQEWIVMRLAASGGGTTNDLPDVLAANGQYVLAIEAKAWTPPDGSAAKYDGLENIHAVTNVAHAFNGDALIAIRWKGTKQWHFQFASEIATTDTQFKVYHGETMDWMTLEDLPGNLSFEYVDD